MQAGTGTGFERSHHKLALGAAGGGCITVPARAAMSQPPRRRLCTKNGMRRLNTEWE